MQSPGTGGRSQKSGVGGGEVASRVVVMAGVEGGQWH